jgi:hypothetical protein
LDFSQATGAFKDIKNDIKQHFVLSGCMPDIISIYKQMPDCGHGDPVNTFGA